MVDLTDEEKSAMRHAMKMVAEAMEEIGWQTRLIDLTEWDPPLDATDLSALTAARWVAECLAGFATR